MLADLAEDGGEEIGAAVDHVRVVGEIVGRVDEAEQLDHLRDPAEIAGGFGEHGEHVEPGEPRMFVGLIRRHVHADLARVQRAVGLPRPLTGNEDQRSRCG